MIDPHVRLKIDSALIAYDKRQAGREGYNRFAFAHYLGGVQNVDELTTQGMPLDLAIAKMFSGRVRDCILKAAGFDPKHYDPFGRRIVATAPAGWDHV